jgi:hypothetical protein
VVIVHEILVVLELHFYTSGPWPDMIDLTGIT